MGIGDWFASGAKSAGKVSNAVPPQYLAKLKKLANSQPIVPAGDLPPVGPKAPDAPDDMIPMTADSLKPAAWNWQDANGVWKKWQAMGDGTYEHFLDMAESALHDQGISTPSKYKPHTPVWKGWVQAQAEMKLPSHWYDFDFELGVHPDVAKTLTPGEKSILAAKGKAPEGFTLQELGDPIEPPTPPPTAYPQWMEGHLGNPPIKRSAGEGIREYVQRLRQMHDNYQSKRGSVASSVRNLEKEMADNLHGGGIGQIMPDEWLKENDAGGGFAARNKNTRDYIDYLAAHGVDQRTLDSIASGELDMSPQARMARAEQHDLDPKTIWHRWDHPLKTEMKGFTGAALSQPEKRRYKQGTLKFVNLEPSKEGLVYTSHSPEYAKRGVQIPQDQVTLYPLLGPKDGIAGLDDLPPSAYDTFRSKQSEALLKKYPDTQKENAGIRRASQRVLHLAEPLVDPQFVQGPLRNATRQELSMVRPNDETLQKSQGTIPFYANAEDRKTYTEPLMASGAKGTLVRDETGLSTAFTPAGAGTLRRADLAPLDTRFRMSRNLLQSLLAPVAVGAGAGALSQPSVLGGLRETR